MSTLGHTGWPSDRAHRTTTTKAMESKTPAESGCINKQKLGRGSRASARVGPHRAKRYPSGERLPLSPASPTTSPPPPPPGDGDSRVPFHLLDRFADEILEHTKELGLFDEMRMKLLEGIECSKEFRRIKRDFKDELESFCSRADLSLPRAKLREKLNPKTLYKSARLLRDHVQHVSRKHRHELRKLYNERASQFLKTMMASRSHETPAETDDTELRNMEQTVASDANNDAANNCCPEAALVPEEDEEDSAPLSTASSSASQADSGFASVSPGSGGTGGLPPADQQRLATAAVATALASETRTISTPTKGKCKLLPGIGHLHSRSSQFCREGLSNGSSDEQNNNRTSSGIAESNEEQQLASTKKTEPGGSYHIPKIKRHHPEPPKCPAPIDHHQQASTQQLKSSWPTKTLSDGGKSLADTTKAPRSWSQDTRTCRFNRNRNSKHRKKDRRSLDRWRTSSSGSGSSSSNDRTVSRLDDERGRPSSGLPSHSKHRPRTPPNSPGSTTSRAETGRGLRRSHDNRDQGRPRRHNSPLATVAAT